MALTPEDVVNKRFQSTKFREGYDQDEVDDFLDEVVVELRRLNHENEELRAQLAGLGHEAVISAPVVAAEPAEVEAPAEPVAAPSAAELEEETGSTSLLVLARRLHEEHVREGVEKKAALIAEGEATAAALIAEAEDKHREIVAQLESERGLLEAKVEELRTFEGEYRLKLKKYIEDQLAELNSSAVG